MPLQVRGINIHATVRRYDIGYHPRIILNDCRRLRNLRVRPKDRIYLPQFDSVAVNLHLPVGTPDKIDYAVIKPVTEITGAIIALWPSRRVQADRKALGGSGRVVRRSHPPPAPR